ncbi:4-hydroxy-2-oxovalerate aldolase [Rubripirellula tenax]|uniref:4-hydroxy-2-oxovalerate aldolase n=1 Tax=Rubripirellula tenax TaxID=2528015 RepID=A0A5C6FEV7_9BACT|nr:aldolase/citrate lyase family protein [Rubripirellula tenax]TWU59257.1 4-hydroxy-2-oxovalerate aldolase [Rubripirellula tenax]
MTNSFRSRLIDHKKLIGTMITLPNAATAEIIADCGFDWLFLDSEHAPLETPDILAILQAVGHRIPCVVRVPSCDEVPIKKVLDLGAQGIVVPLVNTAEQARDVVRFARYAPEGRRGIGLGRAQGYGARFQEYLASANDEVAVIVQAEHAEAVENIDEIVRVPGIDAVFLGPYDLSASLGKVGLFDDSTVTDAINRVTTSCLSANMPLGVFGVSARAVQPFLEQNYTLITVGTDTLFLGTAAKDALMHLR